MQILADIVLYSAIVAPLAVAFFLRLRTYRFFDLSISLPFLTSGYIAYALYAHSVPTWIAMLGGLLSGVTIGLIAFILISFRLLMSVAAPLTLLLASLAVSVAYEHFLAILFGSSPIPVLGDSQDVDLFGRVLSTQELFSIVFSVTMSVIVSSWYDGVSGVRVRAVAEDRSLARLFGISVRPVFILVALLTSVLAGAAGITYGLAFQLRPSIGLTYVMLGTVSALLFERRARLAAVAGLCVAFLYDVSGTYISSDWQTSIVYCGLLLILISRSLLRGRSWSIT